MSKSSPHTPEPVRDGIVLLGVGRDGASFVHDLNDVPDVVRKLYVTASPTRPIAGSPALLPMRGPVDWRRGLGAALAGAQMLVTVAAVTGREETFVPEAAALGREQDALAVAILVEPLLTNSAYKAEAAARLAKEVSRSADATVLFPAGPQAGAGPTLSEAMANWSQRLSASVRGLLVAAAANDGVNMDFTDIAAVLSGHCRASIGAGRGQTVEDTLRNAAKNSFAPAAQLETARSVFAHVVGGRNMPLDDARRVSPILEHLFPKAEIRHGISIDEDLGETRATILAGKLASGAGRWKERKRTQQAGPPFSNVGDPTVYDGENLDIPAFVRQDVNLPGAPARPVPAQKTLFEGSSRARV